MRRVSRSQRIAVGTGDRAGNGDSLAAREPGRLLWRLLGDTVSL